MTVTVTNRQGQPLEGVVIMVIDGPESVPDIASVTNERGEGSLGQLATPGQYTLLLSHNQQQVRKAVQFMPGQRVAVQF